MYCRFKEQEYKLHFLELSQSLSSRKHLLFIQSSARLHPTKHHPLLFGTWFNSIGVIHSQHSYILSENMTCDKNVENKVPARPLIPTLALTSLGAERGASRSES